MLAGLACYFGITGSYIQAFSQRIVRTHDRLKRSTECVLV